MSTSAGGRPAPAGRIRLFPRWTHLAVVLVILFFAVIRWRLKDVPLERDEGEYAYAGQLLLHGIPPYKLAYNMKLPGTYGAYAVILALFGQTAAGVHLGLLLVNAATVALVYVLGVRLFGALAGVVAAASYALLSSSESVLGLAGHATHFVVLFVIAGLLLLLEAVHAKRTWMLLGGGLLLGLSFLMKQPGFVFVLFGGLYLIGAERTSASDRVGKGRRLAIYAVAVMTPFALTCVVLYVAGVFRNFWFWTFAYASQYASAVTLSDGLRELWRITPVVVGPSLGIWLLAGIGVSAALWNRTARRHAGFVLGCLAFSFLAVCPGLNFRQHYFILMLPAIALLAGAGVSCLAEKLSSDGRGALRLVPIAMFLAAFASAVYSQRSVFFGMSPKTLSRAIYRENPFPEAPVIADYLKNHSAQSDRIAVLGSEPEIYFYSDRQSATGYIYTYGLMERQVYALEMQKQAIHEIEESRPEFIVSVNVPVSWGVRPDSERLIFGWADRYLREQYEITGAADILEDPKFYWGDEAKSHQPRSRFTVAIFKRKPLDTPGTLK